MTYEVSVIPMCCISGLGCVFVAKDVMEYKMHIQDMKDYFLIRFKCCLSR